MEVSGRNKGDGGLAKLRAWARRLKRDVHAVYLAARDSRAPWYARVAAILVAAYALSPIDLIPDFIPVLGYVDDILIVPLGILLVVQLIPVDVLEEHRKTAEERRAAKPTSYAAAIFIVGMWVLAAAALYQYFSH